MSGLTQEERDWRLNYIGGSDAGRIMSGDWYTLFMEKTGRQEHEDLSWVLPVQMGNVTEALNVKWYENVSGNKVSRKGQHVICEDDNLRFLACTLDGYVYPNTVFQAKHVNAFAKPEEVHDKYLPQVTHEMIVTGATTAHLSVFIGTLKHEVIQINLDPFYAEEYIAQARRFWEHVTTDTPPQSNAEPAAFVPKMAALRKVSMQGNNQWAASADDWLKNKVPAKTFKTAEATIKELIEEDVCEAAGHGIIVKRAKNGALSIKENK